MEYALLSFINYQYDKECSTTKLVALLHKIYWCHSKVVVWDSYLPIVVAMQLKAWV